MKTVIKLSSKITQLLAKTKDSDIFPFICLAIIMLVLHASAYPPTGDSGIFKRAVEANGLWSEYETSIGKWSSRIIIELLVRVVSILPYAVWCIFDTGIILLAAASVSMLIHESPNRRKLNWTIALLIIFFPQIFSNAGYIAATTNYLWPLCFAIFSLVAVKKVYYNEKIRIYQYILFFIATLIGTDMELHALSLAAIFALFLLYFILQKTFKPFIVIQFIVAVTRVAYSLFFSPGNDNRMQHEIATWMPDFYMHSFVSKINMAVSATLQSYMSKSNFTQSVSVNLIFLCAICVIYIWLTQRSSFYRGISLVPLTMSVMGLMAVFIIPLYPPAHKLLATNVIDLSNFTTIAPYIPLLFGILAVLLLTIEFYIIFGSSKKTILLIVVLWVGIFTRLVMANSPTLYASSSRTFACLDGAIFFCGIFIYNELQTFRLINSRNTLKM